MIYPEDLTPEELQRHELQAQALIAWAELHGYPVIRSTDPRRHDVIRYPYLIEKSSWFSHEYPGFIAATSDLDGGDLTPGWFLATAQAMAEDFEEQAKPIPDALQQLLTTPAPPRRKWDTWL